MDFKTLVADVENVEHTVVGWIAKEYAKLYNAEPTLEAVADAAFAYAVPAVQILISATGNSAAATLIGNVATEAQKDLLVVSALIHDFGPTPSAAGILSTIKSNLSSLLADSHITDAVHVAIITKVVNALGVLAAAIAKAIASAAPAPASAAA